MQHEEPVKTDRHAGAIRQSRAKRIDEILVNLVYDSFFFAAFDLVSFEA